MVRVGRPVDPEQAAARRESITLAAAELFARKGFERTTATDIAKAAGISSGSVFYHFGDKRAVFRSVFERDLPSSRALVERCRALPDPVEAILIMVDELAAEALSESAPGMVVELLRQVDKDPELAQVVTENTAILREGFAALIERGIRAGTVDPELEPGEAAEWVQTIVDAAFLNASAGRDPRPMLRRIVARFLTAPNTSPGEHYS